MKKMIVIGAFISSIIKCSAMDLDTHASLSEHNHGGKSQNLFILSKIAEANVPKFSTIDCDIFKRIILILQNDVASFYYACASTSPDKASSLFNDAKLIRDKICNLTIPDDVIQHLKSLYQFVSNSGLNPIVVRSSSTVEDGVESAFAGLYESILNCRTFHDFLFAVKQVWASNFSNNAIKYYLEKGIDIRTSSMGVVVQEMIDAVASGTAFSVDLATGYNGISVTSNYGLEAVVGGESADFFLFNQDLFLIKECIPEKKLFYKKRDTSFGTEMVELDVGRKERSISVENARNVARMLKIIHDSYAHVHNGHIDTEFCVDKQGVVHFVQVRPLVNVSQESVFDISKSVEIPSPIVIGRYSVGGVNTGRIKVIDSFDKLVTGDLRITDEDIIVAHRTENQWSQFFTKFSGIVTMEGNPTAHPMLVAREHGVPCVIGIHNAVDVLKPYDGELATIDGFRKKVYLGHLQLDQVPLNHVIEMFDPIKAETLPSLSELIAEGIMKKKMFRDDFGGVWFVKPDSTLSGTLLQLQLESFPRRNDLIAKTGAKLPIEIKGEQKVINGKVYEKILGSLQEQVDWLNAMSLDNFRIYFEHENALLSDYMESCKRFDLSIESWNSFCSKYRDLCAYMWLSFITRTSKLQRAFDIGSKLNIPQVYFNEFEEKIQAESFQEDVEFQRDMVTLKEKFEQKFKENLSDINLDDLKRRYPSLFSDLLSISKHYKFSNCIDWIDTVSLTDILKRLDHSCSSGSAIFEEQSVSYFYDNPEFAEWAYLSTLSKIQQNNRHHVRVRGQWLVRDRLIELGNFMLKKGTKYAELVQNDGTLRQMPFQSPTDILRASVNQVREFIKEYSKK